jgi:hypothetical protein
MITTEKSIPETDPRGTPMTVDGYALVSSPARSTIHPVNAKQIAIATT